MKQFQVFLIIYYISRGMFYVKFMKKVQKMKVIFYYVWSIYLDFTTVNDIEIIAFIPCKN